MDLIDFAFKNIPSKYARDKKEDKYHKDEVNCNQLKRYLIYIQADYFCSKKQLDSLRNNTFYDVIREAPELHSKSRVSISIFNKEPYSKVSIRRNIDRHLVVYFFDDGKGSLFINDVMNSITNKFCIKLSDENQMRRLFSMFMKDDIDIQRCVATSDAFYIEDEYIKSNVISNSDNRFCFFKRFINEREFQQSNYVDFYELSVKEG